MKRIRVSQYTDLALNLGVGGKFVIATTISLMFLLSINAYVALNMQGRSLDNLLDASAKNITQTTDLQITASQSSLDLKVKNLAKMLSTIAPAAIAEFDLSLLLAYADVATEDPDISYVAFENIDALTLAQSGDEETIDSPNKVNLPIISDGVPLGKVIVLYNDKRSVSDIQKMEKQSAKSQQMMQDTRDESVSAALVKMIFMLFIILAFGGIIVYVIAQQITKPLGIAADVLRDIGEGEGDLTRRLSFDGHDEVAQVSSSFNTFSEKIHALVIKIKYAAESINQVSVDIANSNGDLSSRTTEQAAHLEEISSSITELTSGVGKNADDADNAYALVLKAADDAVEGGNMVEQAEMAMKEIEAFSSDIVNIIGVINEIAFQTNLLALNAAVEAAHAGEQGRGFAVVASEVRSLSHRSAEAAKEINTLINNSVMKISTGTQLVYDSGFQLKKIISNVKKVSEVISEISTSSREQSQSIDQVNVAMRGIDEMTQQNAALTEEMSATSVSMGEQSRSLAALISQFKINDSVQFENSTKLKAVKTIKENDNQIQVQLQQANY
ncbi:MAG: methyl-accepting chemotaxis protein [Candidatus Bathyarchaeota archaeon]|nr:methyl-accepting chemotaxis protein [Candidatus Bathyarchaeota archaeon]